jgi:hypothetical protein
LFIIIVCIWLFKTLTLFLFQVAGLINYWPIQSRNVLDYVGGAHLYGGANWNYTADRFGTAGSAISLSSGYLQAPTGVYFTAGRWKAKWYDSGKQKQKNYSVEALGYETAFNEAGKQREAAVEQIYQRRAAKVPKQPSGEEGVYWHERCQAWCAEWRCDRNRKSRSFSVKKYGEEEALRSALEIRREAEDTGRAETFVGKRQKRRSAAGPA